MMIKKYKLLKDIPLIKKGGAVKIITSMGYDNIHINHKRKQIELSQKDLDKMLQDGWLKLTGDTKS